MTELEKLKKGLEYRQAWKPINHYPVFQSSVFIIHLELPAGELKNEY